MEPKVRPRAIDGPQSILCVASGPSSFGNPGEDVWREKAIPEKNSSGGWVCIAGAVVAAFGVIGAAVAARSNLPTGSIAVWVAAGVVGSVLAVWGWHRASKAWAVAEKTISVDGKTPESRTAGPGTAAESTGDLTEKSSATTSSNRSRNENLAPTAKDLTVAPAPPDSVYRLLIAATKLSAYVTAGAAIVVLLLVVARPSVEDTLLLKADWPEAERARLWDANSKDMQDGGFENLERVRQDVDRLVQVAGGTEENGFGPRDRYEAARLYHEDIDALRSEIERARWITRLLYVFGIGFVALLLFRYFAGAVRQPDQEPSFWG